MGPQSGGSAAGVWVCGGGGGGEEREGGGFSMRGMWEEVNWARVQLSYKMLASFTLYIRGGITNGRERGGGGGGGAKREREGGGFSRRAMCEEVNWARV